MGPLNGTGDDLLGGHSYFLSVSNDFSKNKKQPKIGLHCPFNAAFIKRIFLKQKRALRIVYGGKYNCHTAPILKKYNILPYPELLPKICLGI